MSGHGTATERGFVLSGREWAVVGGASALMALNVLVMYAFVATPLALVNDYLFAYPIVGVLVYGAAIAGGELLAERGVERGGTGLALAGVAILQVAFGTFGAGVLSFVPRDARLPILAITAVVVTAMVAAIGTYVYARSKQFDHYRSWANYAFLGGVLAVLVGTFLAPVLLLGFLLIFLGFLFRLGWEIWRIRDGRVATAALQAIGLYVAVAGVFVHVLQIVIRTVARR
ncbi:hypothetical protein [Halorarum salinum]|uniref:Uncharacterized protein n=1 Tax=Halorarum salinum TaxID=2743089 RepID=A0A7D5QIN2_9EURY|nr:hypothetical protein [Halobaculum salinum]QLG63522.1 hypothetical protein HUG12_18035 [Halobaculum salinum]